MQEEAEHSGLVRVQAQKHLYQTYAAKGLEKISFIAAESLENVTVFSTFTKIFLEKYFTKSPAALSMLLIL